MVGRQTRNSMGSVDSYMSNLQKTEGEYHLGGNPSEGNLKAKDNKSGYVNNYFGAPEGGSGKSYLGD